MKATKSRNFLAADNKWRRWGIGFGVWTMLGLSFASRTYLSSYQNGSDIPWERIFSGYLIDFYLWGIASPVIFKLSRRFPVERENPARRLLFHTVLSIIFAFGVHAVSLPTFWYLGYPDVNRTPTLAALFQTDFLNPYYLHQGLLVYWATLIAAHAFEYYRQLRVNQIQAAELTAQLAQAQLAALKMQIHPHFLFNTLNSIAALLHKDAEAADRMIARLSDFLRMTLKSSDVPIVTLGQELEFLKTYLEIEKTRFQDKLIVELNIAPDTLEAHVPNLILQPLVENAVRHGIARLTSNGRLEISVCRADSRLIIEIKDNGLGLMRGVGSNGGAKRNGQEGGVGLANTQARLEQFFEGDFAFKIADRQSESGTIVTLNIPFLV